MSDDAGVEEINEEPDDNDNEPDDIQPFQQDSEQNLQKEPKADEDSEKSNDEIPDEHTKQKEEVDDLQNSPEDPKIEQNLEKGKDDHKELEKSNEEISGEDTKEEDEDDRKEGYEDKKDNENDEKEDDEAKKDDDEKEDDEGIKDDNDDKKEDDEDKKKDGDRKEVEENEEIDQIDQYEEEEEIRTKRVFSTSYLSSIYENRPEKCISINSLYPPHSWPSSARLSMDSDVYPKESEYNLEVVTSKLKMFRTISTVGKEESKFDLHETSNGPTDHTECVSVKPEVSIKIKESVKPITLEKVEEEFEDFKVIDIPFLKEVLDLPINPEAVKKICFSETLLISYEFYNEYDKEENCGCTPLFKKSHLLHSRGVQEMGGMSLNIESSDCFLTTFCTTQFSCLGSAGASRLLSVVDHEFGLIEEKKTEWHCMHDKKIEKSLHVARDGSNFVAFRTNSTDDNVERHRGNISLKTTGDLVLDGGLFALMRYLVISDFTGEFETWSVHITGDVCRCKFIVGSKKNLYINNNPYLVKRIKKEFYRDHRYPDVSKSYFLLSGHLVRHQWKGCRYFIHINPLSRIPPKKHNIEYSWKDDIMLMSKYLDEKQKRQSEIKTYMGDHPEIKSILQDYMLCLLQLKPDRVLEFTIDYFINLFRE